jgi:hypothetical protein
VGQFEDALRTLGIASQNRPRFAHLIPPKATRLETLVRAKRPDPSLRTLGLFRMTDKLPAIWPFPGFCAEARTEHSLLC